MKKIPSLFKRDHSVEPAVLTEEVTPGCEWVLASEGTATRKWDGTAYLRTPSGKWWQRYDAKHGKTPPPDFMPAQPTPDEVTGHWPGWVPARPDKRFDEAFNLLPNWAAYDGSKATFELVGPKVNGNPENAPTHLLIPHGIHTLPESPRTFLALQDFLKHHDIEGIVWWRDRNDPDCDKVKLKKKDFGFKR